MGINFLIHNRINITLHLFKLGDKMARPKGRDARPIVEPIRRKCSTCGKIKVVKHRSWKIPTNSSQFNIPIYNKNANHKKREDQTGTSVKNYCSIECAGDTFLNKYTEDDFDR